MNGSDSIEFDPAQGDFDAILLDYHLGRLTPEERAAVERRVGAEPRLAGQHEALSACMRALGAYSVPAAPKDLKSRVLARVAQAGSPLKVRRSGRGPAQEGGLVLIPMQTFRDIAAVAAVIVLMVGVGVPSLLHMRERSQRTVCSMNLGQIGQAMGSYASAFGDSLPFVGWSSAASWRPTAEPNVTVIPNRRHLYPLVRGAYVPTGALVCPSTRDQPMSGEAVRAHDDFLESRNVSYANQNMAGVRPSIHDHPDLPVMGDDNPFFDNGMPLFEVARSLGLADPANSNSRAHGGAGQNLLTLSGAVKWTTSPNAGIFGDNIWTLSDVAIYTGREGPRTTSDSHLLK